MKTRVVEYTLLTNIYLHIRKKKKKITSTNKYKTKITKKLFNKLRKGFDQTRLSIFTVDLSLPTD